jgi:hypothetical protein
MINNALSDYSDMSDDFEFEKDEEEVTIRPMKLIAFQMIILQ